jgi:hypothetical protein
MSKEKFLKDFSEGIYEKHKLLPKSGTSMGGYLVNFDGTEFVNWSYNACHAGVLPLAYRDVVVTYFHPNKFIPEDLHKGAEAYYNWLFNESFVASYFLVKDFETAFAFGIPVDTNLPSSLSLSAFQLLRVPFLEHYNNSLAMFALIMKGVHPLEALLLSVNCSLVYDAKDKAVRSQRERIDLDIEINKVPDTGHLPFHGLGGNKITSLLKYVTPEMALAAYAGERTLKDARSWPAACTFKLNNALAKVTNNPTQFKVSNIQLTISAKRFFDTINFEAKEGKVAENPWPKFSENFTTLFVQAKENKSIDSSYYKYYLDPASLEVKK